MKKKINFIESTMKSSHIIIAFVCVMMLLGIFGLKNMPRREFPEFTIRQGLVVGIFPEASSEEVAEKLTKEVENFIFGFEEVNKSGTYSHSKEGMMVIFVELNDNITNSDKFWSKLRLGLNEFKMQLPGGVLALVGNNDFGDTSALLITMSSESKSYRELEEVMKHLEADIRVIDAVSKVKRFGTQDEEIFVYVQSEKLEQYNINPSMILTAFKFHESLDYSGELDNGELVLPIHLPPHFESETDLEEQIIYSDPLGNIVRLKDVARVVRKYDDPDSFIRNNKKNALLLSLEMQKGNNIVQFGEQVREILAAFKEKTSKDVAINIISDLPSVVDNSISHFMKEFLIAIFAVIGVTMLFLPLRVSTVAAVTIPISIIITIGIMQLLGLQLHIVSLAGLIVVLGMVVDNAIVVIDGHLEKLDEGESPWEAAWKSSTELVVPVLTATLAILAAYFPLTIFMSGMSLDFVGSLPITIGIALTVSMILALLLVPILCAVFIKKGMKVSDDKKPKFDVLGKLHTVYSSLLDWTFRNPKLTIGIGLASFVLGCIILSSVKQKMFPSMDRKQFAIEVNLKEGASLKQTEAVIDSLENVLKADKRITNIASFIGEGSPRFNDLYMPHMPGKNYGQLIVNTISNAATIAILDEYEPIYWNAFPNAFVKWKQIAIEDFIAPIEIRLSGHDLAALKQGAEQIKEIVNKHEKTTWVRSDWGDKRQAIKLDLDRTKANQLGYSKSFVAASLLTSLNGIPLTTVWEGDYPVNVVLSKEPNKNPQIVDLNNEYTSSVVTFKPLPIRAIATLKPELTEGTVVRRNGLQTISILADLKRNVIPSEVFVQLQKQIEACDLDTSIKLDYGGDHEFSMENMKPLILSLGVSIVLIFLILLVQFKTFKRVLLVMSTMLLSIFGAAFGLKVTGYPFSMTAFIGIIGLMGIVVRNGIILIDYALTLVHKEGMTYKEAGLAAGKRRMRPIFLTSMAAAVGVIPMIISKSPLWGPMGTVLCFGLVLGMILTLLVLPVTYWKFNK